jgi:integrase
MPRLTKRVVDAIRRDLGRDVFVWDQGDGALKGFGLRMKPSGAASYLVQYRTREGRTRRLSLGRVGVLTPEEARKLARARLAEVIEGADPSGARREKPVDVLTVGRVLDDFIARHARNKDRPLRTAGEYERTFDRLVKPVLGATPLYELRRRQVAELLDRIEDDNGPVMADRTLAYLRKALNWQAARDDLFAPPIVKGMARTRPKERARDRVLSDDEIRAVWPHLDGIFGAFVKVLLLTGQRREEVAQMAWGELDHGDVWTIPADRYKTKHPNIVPLPSLAKAIIGAQPRVNGCDYVFAGRTGTTPFSGFSKGKALLDKAVERTRGKPLPNWTLHDLRRTAKTLMVRAGVRPDISERVLGHVIAGVEGVYDRHAYVDEKRAALETLAATIERLLVPPAGNVAVLAERRRRAGQAAGAANSARPQMRRERRKVYNNPETPSAPVRAP